MNLFIILIVILILPYILLGKPISSTTEVSGNNSITPNPSIQTSYSIGELVVDIIKGVVDIVNKVSEYIFGDPENPEVPYLPPEMPYWPPVKPKPPNGYMDEPDMDPTESDDL